MDAIQRTIPTLSLAEREVGEIGLGCMGMSWAYGTPDDESSLRVLARSLELGVNHWDTADMYGAGENEKLVARALKANGRDRVFLATKFGNVYDRSLTSHQDQVQANAGWIVDGTPTYARKAIEASLQRLETDHVDLYYLHRVDDRTPIEDTVGEMSRFVEEGKARAIGLSECSAETLRRAAKVAKIAAVQSELSIWTRDYVEDVLPLTRELGIAYVAYSPLGRGFLTGAIDNLDSLEANDWRRMNPRFQGENLVRNQAILGAVREIAAAKKAAPGQVAIAWTLAKGENVLPIPGTKRVRYLEENSAASFVELTPEELERLNALPPAEGERYPEASARTVNR